MEVVNENAYLLSNFEVYQLLNDIQSGKGKPGKKQPHLATISYSAQKYLEKTPCREQTPEIIQTFMQALMPYNLNKAEKLQLLNQRPTTAVEIQLLIEESEERLTEEQIDELLELIANTLPGDPVDEEMQVDADNS